MWGKTVATVAKYGRGFATSAIRREHKDYGHYTGSNLPFQVHNKYRLTLVFALFFGTAFALPFVAVRHQLIKGRS